jgi:hypothetical protein
MVTEPLGGVVTTSKDSEPAALRRNAVAAVHESGADAGLAVAESIPAYRLQPER